MKKYLFPILVLLSLAFGAMAQQVTVTDYPAKKGINMMQANHTRVIADDGNEMIIVAQVASGVITTYKNYVVMAYDKADKYRSVELPDTKEQSLLASTYVDGNVYMLFVSTDKSNFTISRAVVNVATMKITTPLAPMYHESISKNDLPMTKVAVSPSREFVGLIYGVFSAATKDMQVKEVMLDNTLDELWNKRYPLGAVDDMLVSDEGEMQTMIYYNDKKTNRSHFRFGVLDVDNETVQEATLDAGNIASPQLLNCVHGKFVVSGQLTDGTGYQHNTMFSGLCGIVYDMKRREATMSTHLFTAEEVNVLENNSFKSRTRDTRTGGITPMSWTRTDFGGAIAVARLYSVTTYGAKTGTNTDYFMTGALVAGIDTNGAFVWQKPFRTYFKESEYMFFFNIDLCSQGGTVYVLQSENEKNGEVYDITTPARQKAINGYKARTAVYTIDRKGDVGKGMYGEPAKQKVVSALCPMGGGRYGFVTSMLNQTAFHTLTIK